MNNYQAQQTMDNISSIIGFATSIIFVGFMVGMVRSFTGNLLPEYRSNLDYSNPETWLERLGDCYRLAWRFIIKEDEGWLVHGKVFGGSPPRWIEHAWVELPTGFIYEPVADTFCKKDTFYQAYRAEELKRYTPTEAAKLAVKFSHYGPW